MKIMVMGVGAIGEATAHMLKKRGHDPMLYDPPKGLTCDPTEAEIVFVCVPAPTRRNGDVDLSIVRACLELLPDFTIVALRSTVPPGTTKALQEEFATSSALRMFFVPEFLTEATRFNDAENPSRVLVGAAGSIDGDTVARLCAMELLELFPVCEKMVMRATDAEAAKYAANGFYSLKVAFMNQMFDAFGRAGVNWEQVRRSIEADPMTGNDHTEIFHNGYRGFGGKCLPKDARAFTQFARKHGVTLTILEEAIRYNRLLRGAGHDL